MTPRATVSLALVLLAACGACSHEEPTPRWPVSAPITLESELAASAESTRPPLLPDGSRSEIELPPDAPGLHARSFVFQGLWVAEVVLGEVEGDPTLAALPLVVMLHGRGDRPRIPGGPFGRVPTAMRVLIPRGPLALGDGYAWARFSVTETARLPELAEDLVQMSARLARLVRHVAATRPTLGTPIVTGFSQGAILAWTTALRWPDQVGLALPIAGWVPPGARPSAWSPPGAPVRAMHGTTDPTVKIGPTRELVAELRQAGFAVEWIEYEGVAHVVSPAMNERFETWLEDALRERAPRLGGGLGVAGPDPEPMPDAEPVLEDDLEEEASPAPLPDGLPEEEVEEEALEEEGASETEEPDLETEESGGETDDSPEGEDLEATPEESESAGDSLGE